MVRVNCEAVVVLTRAFLPAMIERRGGGVIVVASTAGMQPLPYEAVYAASKAFALNFTDALHAELRGTGVRCLAVNPGPVPTEWQQVAGWDGMTKAPGTIAAERVVAESLAAYDRGARSVMPGRCFAGRCAARRSARGRSSCGWPNASTGRGAEPTGHTAGAGSSSNTQMMRSGSWLTFSRTARTARLHSSATTATASALILSSRVLRIAVARAAAPPRISPASDSVMQPRATQVTESSPDQGRRISWSPSAGCSDQLDQTDR